jgi:hypothetical protein
MIDKKVLLLIGALVVVAVVVLAVSLIGPSGSHVSGSSFSALFDKMEKRAGTTADLVLPSSYTNGEVVTVTDTVVARELDIHDGNVKSTTLFFNYEGTKWINETSATTFNVLTNLEDIKVVHAAFSIQLNGDWSGTISVGEDVTLQTVVTVLPGGVLVLKNSWVPVL